jgi:hypothetical protein
MNSSVCSGDCHSRQGQNCDSLFHNNYKFDAAAGRNIITRVLPFCKRSTADLDVAADEIFRKVAVAWALLN